MNVSDIVSKNTHTQIMADLEEEEETESYLRNVVLFGDLGIHIRIHTHTHTVILNIYISKQGAERRR